MSTQEQRVQARANADQRFESQLQPVFEEWLHAHKQLVDKYGKPITAQGMKSRLTKMVNRLNVTIDESFESNKVSDAPFASFHFFEKSSKKG